MKQVRLDLGLTQSQLAKEMGIGKNSLAAYESGAVHPTSTVLRKFLLVTDASPYYLFDLKSTADEKLAVARRRVPQAYIRCNDAAKQLHSIADYLKEIMEAMKN